MSPFASSTNVRPVYSPGPSMVPLPTNPPANQAPPPAMTSLIKPANPSMHENSYDMAQVLPPYLGNPSEEPRLQFVALPHSHSGMGPPLNEEHLSQMAPGHDAQQQVMYIYVDEEGKTIATKITDPSEGE